MSNMSDELRRALFIPRPRTPQWTGIILFIRIRKREYQEYYSACDMHRTKKGYGKITLRTAQINRSPDGWG